MHDSLPLERGHPPWRDTTAYAGPILLVLGFLFCLAGVAFASGHEEEYRLALVINSELETLRWYMGRPENGQEDIGVSNVSPHEVYFQAMTLFEKANRLSYERARNRANPPDRPTGAIEPEDVRNVLQAALERIELTGRMLDVPKDHAFIDFHGHHTYTDVFKAVINANRQLNLLLDRQYSPSEAFTQVTVAVSYCESLLEALQGASSLPDPPFFVPGKRPQDVYQGLLMCYQLIQSIGERMGLDMLELDVDAVGEVIQPSDVFDIASLIVSELAFIREQVPNAPEPQPVFATRDKFPSHVYQRVGMLQRQLVELLDQVEEHPPTSRQVD